MFVIVVVIIMMMQTTSLNSTKNINDVVVEELTIENRGLQYQVEYYSNRFEITSKILQHVLKPKGL
jgi:hypothetical protein